MHNIQGSPELGSVVHFGISPKEKEQGRHEKIGCFENWDTICGSGSYHIRYTKDINQVTCKACKARLKGVKL